MQTKRPKGSENTEDKRVCIKEPPREPQSPSMLQTSVSGQKEQKPSHFKEWGTNDVASFLSGKGFDDYASTSRGIL